MEIGSEFVLGATVIDCDVVMQERRAQLHRFERIEHCRQRLIVDVNHIHRLLSCVQRLGGDGGNAVADKAHAIPAQHGHVANLFADQMTLDFTAGEYRLHAPNALRFRNVDIENARV